MNVPTTIFFEVMASNEPEATVEIRAMDHHYPHQWIYQITESHPPRIFRGTVNTATTSPLDLIATVLADHADHYPTPTPTDALQSPITPRPDPLNPNPSPPPVGAIKLEEATDTNPEGGLKASPPTS